MKLKRALALVLTVAIMAVSPSVVNFTVKAEQNPVKQLALEKIDVPEEQTLLSKKTKFLSIAKAADSVRDKVLNHEPMVSVYIKTRISVPVEVYKEFRKELTRVTDQSDEGDYMLWDLQKEEPKYRCSSEKKAGKTYYYYYFEINYSYYTTLSQKNQVDQKVTQIINGFNFTETTTDYEKVKTVYDYVCSSVSYAKDTNPLIVYTSWAALYNNEAVCQGYAQLLYKMLKELGISNRVIPGRANGGNHGWNIVRLGEYYYNMDATWDSELYHNNIQYQFFLKGDDFNNHKRLDEYMTDEFYTEYPMAEKDYGKENQSLSLNSQKAKIQIIKPLFISVKRKKIKIRKIDEVKKYEVLYSTGKKFKKKKKLVTSKTIFKLKKLKKGEKYYVKFRGYCYLNGKRVNTEWSTIKKIKK